MDKKLDRETRVTYAIFATNTGKGYGCFAIKHVKGTTRYEVAASFCHPTDRKKFSKKEAIEKSVNRLNSPQWTVDVESEFNSFKEIIKLAIQKSTKAPSWVTKAVERGMLFHTLKLDCCTNDELVFSV